MAWVSMSSQVSRLQPQVHFFHRSLLKCLKYFRPRTDLLLHGCFFAQNPINECASQSVRYRMTQRNFSDIFTLQKWGNLSPRVLCENYKVAYFLQNNGPFLSLITMCDLQKLWKFEEQSLHKLCFFSPSSDCLTRQILTIIIAYSRLRNKHRPYVY